MKKCYNCGAEWTGPDRPGFNDTCPKCGAYAYVCLNCRFYDENTSRGCQLTTTEPVRQKDRPNFCDEFKLADRPADWRPQDKAKHRESAREKFDRLFKNPPTDPPSTKDTKTTKKRHL